MPVLTPEKPPLESPAQAELQPELAAQLGQAMDYNIELRSGATSWLRERRGEQPVHNHATRSEAFKILDTMSARADLLKDLDGHDPSETESLTEPALTVCIPVAVTKEDPGRVAHTVALIKRSQQQLGKPVDVILWANAKYAEDEESATREAAEADYRTMNEALRPINGDGLRIQTALEVLPEEEVTMINLRTNYMDALAVKAVEHGYGVDHPVLWMDVDTTALSKGALGAIEKSVRDFDALMVHTNIRYNLDWASGTPFGELDAASKAVAIHEIDRRSKARFIESTGKTREDIHEYVDEPGLAFALGSYLTGGGLYQQEDGIHKFASGMDESLVLGRNLLIGSKRMPQTLFKDAGPKQPLIYLQEARMGVSDRRLHRDVHDYGVEAFKPFRNIEYELSSDQPQATKEEPVQIKNGDFKEFIDTQREMVRYRSVLGQGDPDVKKYEISQGITEPTPEAIKAMRASARIVDKLVDEHFPPRKPQRRFRKPKPAPK